MTKFYATIEKANSREAIVTLHDATGEWHGSQLVQVKSGRNDDLYEHGYTLACAAAAGKCGTVESYRWVGQ